MSGVRYYAYVVPSERISGVADSWAECEKLVRGKTGARYKGFKTKTEAERWLNLGASYAVKRVKKLPRGIYFDAGTGGGLGVRVNVTDENGKSFLRGRRWTLKGASNNHGELLASHEALKIATRRGVKKVFGDSRLVIDYWSRGFVKKRKASPATIKLIGSVSKLRKKFEAGGGKLKHISGDDNPADLGFHRRR